MANAIQENPEKVSRIDESLAILERKVAEINGQGNIYGFEKENEKYYAMAYGETLDVPIIKPETLVKVLDLINLLISIYQKEGYTGKFYAAESGSTKGDSSYSAIDLNVEKDYWFDTKFLTDNGWNEVFGDPDNRNEMKTQKLADFLNVVIVKTMGAELQNNAIDDIDVSKGISFDDIPSLKNVEKRHKTRLIEMIKKEKGNLNGVYTDLIKGIDEEKRLQATGSPNNYIEIGQIDTSSYELRIGDVYYILDTLNGAITKMD